MTDRERIGIRPEAGVWVDADAFGQTPASVGSIANPRPTGGLVKGLCRVSRCARRCANTRLSDHQRAPTEPRRRQRRGQTSGAAPVASTREAASEGQPPYRLARSESGGLQTNEQLAAIARLAIGSLESDLADVEFAAVKVGFHSANS